MSKLEDWKKKRREFNIRPFNEVEKHIKANAQPISYKLEILIDSEANSLVIQGNIEGIMRLRNDLDSLIESGVVGDHFNLEDGHGLTQANVSITIQLIGED